MRKDAAGRRPTIKEVAALAGLSHQTVSRYLRSDTGMKDATKERIRSAIAELDYRPNLLARAMRTRRTGRLAVLLPAGEAISSLELVGAATAVARDAGFVLEVVTLSEPPEMRAPRVMELADSGLFEGILSLMALPLSPEQAETGEAPIVVVPTYDDGMRSVGLLADASCVADLVERLAGQGHRRFLHLAGDYAHTSARNRRQVYLDAVARLGLESHRVADVAWSAEGAREAVRALPADGSVTAVIGANDVVAAGAIRGAWERGWSVPGDLSVTGWANDPLGAVMVPSLTSVSVDHAALGRHLAATLLARLAGDEPPPAVTRLTRVEWRESTGPAPGSGPRPDQPAAPGRGRSTPATRRG